MKRTAGLRWPNLGQVFATGRGSRTAAMWPATRKAILTNWWRKNGRLKYSAGGFARFTWAKARSAQNEAFDTRCYNRAALEYLKARLENMPRDTLANISPDAIEEIELGFGRRITNLKAGAKSRGYAGRPSAGPTTADVGTEAPRHQTGPQPEPRPAWAPSGPQRRVTAQAVQAFDEDCRPFCSALPRGRARRALPPGRPGVGLEAFSWQKPGCRNRKAGCGILFWSTTWPWKSRRKAKAGAGGTVKGVALNPEMAARYANYRLERMGLPAKAINT